jgi:hypothetical protein
MHSRERFLAALRGDALDMAPELDFLGQKRRARFH